MKTTNSVQTKNTIRNLRYSSLLILAALSFNGCAKPSASNEQFGAATETQGLFTDVALAHADEFHTEEDDNSRRNRYVQVDVAVLKEALLNAIAAKEAGRNEALRMNLYDDVAVDVALDDIQKKSEDNIVVVGRIVGDPNSAVTLVLNKGVIVGNIRRGESLEEYEIRVAKGQVHVIRTPEPTQEEECETVHAHGSSTGGSLAHDHQDESHDQGSLVQANPVIDILVAYTPKAKATQGGEAGMHALIQMGIADTNQAFVDSGVALEVRLAGTLELKQNETGSYQRDLNSLKSKTDGRWDEVHAARARVGADQVSVIGAYSTNKSVAGIGFFRADAASAFTVTKASMFKQYTFSHELGHNLGLAHGDGFVSRQGGFRTILAYGSLPRIRRYSNPSLHFNGYVTGSNAHNEVAILNKNAGRMSSLMTPAAR